MGHLVGRERLAQCGQQPRDIHALARLLRDEEHGHFAEFRMRRRHHGAVPHAREDRGHLLDLGRRDVLTAADDQLFQPAGDGQEAIRIRAREVTRAIPALSQRLRSLFRLVVIAEHDVRAAHDEFTLGARRHILTPCGIEQPHRQPRHRQAAGAQRPHALHPVHRDHGAGLDDAVAVQQARADASRSKMTVAWIMCNRAEARSVAETVVSRPAMSGTASKISSELAISEIR